MRPSVAQILADPQLNGVYRFEGESDLLPSLDAAGVSEKHSLLAALAWIFEFPDYYGANWDALEECLTDMSWWQGGIALQVQHADRLSPAVRENLLRIFAQAAADWRDAGRVCSLFVSGLEDRDLPAAE